MQVRRKVKKKLKTAETANHTEMTGSENGHDSDIYSICNKECQHLTSALTGTVDVPIFFLLLT